MRALKGQRILLTGAAGGIGCHLSRLLADAGAKLALLDVNAEVLNDLVSSIGQTRAIAVPADISSAAGCRISVSAVWNMMEGVDYLINLAGLSSFCCFEDEEPDHIEKVMQVNLLAPMYLTHAILPEMLKRKRGNIINIGSTLGSIGHAWFTTYSASKFGLRGFSESLRRELNGTGVNVNYIAPRAVRTTSDNDAVMKMRAATDMNMDSPELVAQKVFNAIISNKKEIHLGFPESFFVQLNNLFPRGVDQMMAKQIEISRDFAKPAKKN